jgi:CheY-like chemotaxis protein
MIVDDERPLVDVAEEMLAALGYEPSGFHSSTAALQAFRKNPQAYDVVLTDETMPDLLGTDLAREIARLRPDIPILLMSGYTGKQLEDRAHASGVTEVLQKPLVSRDIGESLARVLGAQPAEVA